MFAREPDVRRYGLAGVLLLLLISLPSGLQSQQQRPGRQADPTPQEIATIKTQIRELDGRVIIGFKPVDAVQGMRSDGTPALAPNAVAQLATALEPLGVQVTIQYRIIPAVAAVIDPDRLDELLANPNIDYVEPDRLEEPTAQTTPWGITRVDALSAWTFTKGSGVSVGILDTGIDEDHPDLNPIGGINLVTGGTTRSDWDDNSPICSSTHGTHVAGTVAALDNDIGVVGVAPEVDLYALRVFDPENAGLTTCSVLWSHSILAIEWATTNDLDVINMSFGGLYPSFARGDALFAAYTAGVLPVSSAGNEGQYVSGQVGFPAAQPHVIAVAAIDQSDNVASFSNTGPDIELAGPGVGVYSTLGGGGYGTKNGTSMASPHVAGVAALVRAARPDLSVDEVRWILRSTAQDIEAAGFDWESGYGVANAGAAVAAVASSNLALAVDPMEVTLAAEPGGGSITAPVEIRNVGAAGTIDWTATDDATWITLNPTSGSASDVTPDQFDIAADPSGLGTGFYTGYVTISGNAANSPVTLRVRLAVAPRIALDAASTTVGTLPVGERVRYLLSGTAGQEIDVAVLTDYSATTKLYDPAVRVYLPDGETLLGWNDDAEPAALLSYQSLLYGLSLPVTGDYIIEVGSYADASGGGYLLKARPAGSILGFSTDVVAERGEQNGSTVSRPLQVYDLADLGTLGWTASPSESWITLNPSSGTASPTEPPIAFEGLGIHGAPEGPIEVVDAGLTGVSPDVTGARGFRSVKDLLARGDYDLPSQQLAELEQRLLQTKARGNPGPPRTTNRLQETADTTLVDVMLDPTGLPLEWNVGAVDFQTDDGWSLNQSIPVGFYVYSEGMAIISSGHYYAWGMATGDTREGPPSVVAATRDNDGSLIPISPDGIVGTPIATGIGPPGGLALGEDGNWYVGIRDFSYLVKRVTPDGTVSDFKVLANKGIFWLTWGPANDLFGSSRCLNSGQVYRIPLDGTAEDPISPSLPSCVGGVAYRPQDNSVYVANNLYHYGLTKVSLDDGSSTTLASSVYDVQAVAVGRSGIVYFTDDTGRVWSIDPDLTSTATELALAPGFYNLFGLALTEGALMFLSGGSDGFGEFYSYPVNDGPLPHPAGQALYLARFAPEEMSTADYPGVGDPRAMHGEPFKLPQILYSKDDSNLPAAAFVEEVSWSPADMTYVAVEEGDFGGTFLCNDADAGTQGTLPCTGARADAVDAPSVTLLTLHLQSDPALQPGACVSIGKDVTELSGPLGEDLKPLLEVSSLNVGVRQYAYGDVTHDGTVGAADAVQCLRDLVSLPICPTCDVAMCDVDRDAAMTGTDAVYILRWLVSLGLPPYHRIAMHGLEECQVP